MAITLRDNTSTNSGKGSELTYLEMDTNLESFYFSSSLDGTDLILHTTGSNDHTIDLSGLGVGGAGTQGAQGTTGTGVQGTQGTQGLAGTTSAQGAQGTDGAQGTQGASGVGGGITVDNNVNNYMLTATGGSTINGEANATFTPASGFGSQHWLDIKNGGLSLDSGLISYGYLSSSALPHSQDTTIMTISAATYAAIFIDYQIAAFGSTAQRSGAFMAHWNSAGTVSFANYSTVDVGAISEANTLLRAVYQSPNIEIFWDDPSIVNDNNHGYVATYRLLKRMTIVDGSQASSGDDSQG